MFGISENTARVNALVTGDVHLIDSIDSTSQKQIKQADGVSVFSTPSGAYSDVVMMLDREPGNIPDFVMAVKLLMNRTRMVRSILKGQGTIGNDHPIGPAYADHCEALEQRERVGRIPTGRSPWRPSARP